MGSRELGRRGQPRRHLVSDQLASQQNSRSTHLDVPLLVASAGPAGPTESLAGSVVVLLWWHGGQERGVKLLGAQLRRSAWRSEVSEELGICGRVILPLLRDVIFIEDGFHRTYWFAGSAIHTLVRLDVEHAIALVDAIDGALFDTGPVLEINTRQGDDVGHRLLRKIDWHVRGQPIPFLALRKASAHPAGHH